MSVFGVGVIRSNSQEQQDGKATVVPVVVIPPVLAPQTETQLSEVHCALSDDEPAAFDNNNALDPGVSYVQEPTGSGSYEITLSPAMTSEGYEDDGSLPPTPELTGYTSGARDHNVTSFNLDKESGRLSLHHKKNSSSPMRSALSSGKSSEDLHVTFGGQDGKELAELSEDIMGSDSEVEMPEDVKRELLDSVSDLAADQQRLPMHTPNLESKKSIYPKLKKVHSIDVREPIIPSYNQVTVGDELVEDTPETVESCEQLIQCLKLRKEFVFQPKQSFATVGRENPEYVHPNDIKTAQDFLPPTHKYHYELKDGVYQVWQTDESKTDVDEEERIVKDSLIQAPSIREFGDALKTVMAVVSNPPCRSYTHKRLHMLEVKFKLHHALNAHLEVGAQKKVQHRDFYNVRKVDNHVHHSACMNQKHLLRFIKSRLKKAPNDVVMLDDDGEPVTLKNLFDSLDMTPYDLSVDSLDVRANNTYHRFDRFNKKYSPLASQTLRTVFLKYDNYMKGTYLAHITREVMDDLESNKYQLAEYRLSIYGRRAIEWDVLSAWVVDNNLFSKEVAWMIQIPRLYRIYRQAGIVENFQQMLENIFRPLFEVTLYPTSHPKLHLFLLSVVGFDSVDDESVREDPFHASKNIPPVDWNRPKDPCYARFSYYLYANLLVLNKLREQRGLNSFAYRPHAGEAGDVEHLACTFLLARGINHGINLRRSPVLQYLYYLAQVGISISPLSNNLLFVRLENNPFKTFFFRGLNVTLSTDDPLMIHVTKEPLVEEYSVAAQVWKLTNVDMVEIARNSVLQSGFSHEYKSHWIGNHYFLHSVRGNDIRNSNVPNIRMAFRLRNLEGEYRVLSKHAGDDIQIIDTVRI